MLSIQFLLSGLQEFHKDETFCDYVLKAEEQEFKVHRVVMAACSDYFKVMLMGEMKESREGQVEMKGVSANGLRVVVNFAYTGRHRVKWMCSRIVFQTTQELKPLPRPIR